MSAPKATEVILDGSCELTGGDRMQESIVGVSTSGTDRQADGSSDREEVALIHQQLARLADEKAALEARLVQLTTAASEKPKGAQPKGPVTSRSAAGQKVALFRSLFRGREDVFPQRWENARTGRSGYAPACGNEWMAVLCDKPRIKCTACPNQAFRAVTDGVIDGHLRGRRTVGVYPMLPDCGFRKLWHTKFRKFWHTLTP